MESLLKVRITATSAQTISVLGGDLYGIANMPRTKQETMWRHRGRMYNTFYTLPFLLLLKIKKYHIASHSGERTKEQTQCIRHAAWCAVGCWSDVKIKKAVQEYRATRSLESRDFFSCTFLQLQKQITPVLVIFSGFVKSEGNANWIFRNVFLQVIYLHPNSQLFHFSCLSIWWN